MKMRMAMAALALAAGPAAADGWNDAEVRGTAEGREWMAATPVARMEAPSLSNPMPMGVQEYRPSSTAELAAEIADWEAQKERPRHHAILHDRVWGASPSKTVQLEKVTIAPGGTARGALEDLAANSRYVVYHEVESSEGNTPEVEAERIYMEIDVDFTDGDCGSACWHENTR